MIFLFTQHTRKMLRGFANKIHPCSISRASQAFAKAQMSANFPLPKEGKVFISVNDADKRSVVGIAKRLQSLGFDIVSTGGTHKVLIRHGIRAQRVKKISEGRPNMLDLSSNGEIDLVINTPTGKGHHTDEAKIRSAMVARNIPCLTTINAAEAAVHGIESMREGYEVKAVQDYYADREKNQGK